jgi:hypothetical protein
MKWRMEWILVQRLGFDGGADDTLSSTRNLTAARGLRWNICLVKDEHFISCFRASQGR